MAIKQRFNNTTRKICIIYSCFNINWRDSFRRCHCCESSGAHDVLNNLLLGASIFTVCWSLLKATDKFGLATRVFSIEFEIYVSYAYKLRKFDLQLLNGVNLNDNECIFLVEKERSW